MFFKRFAYILVSMVICVAVGFANNAGQLVWKYKTGAEILSSPYVHNKKVYFGSQDKYFYCLDMYSGKKIWSYKTGDKITTTPIVSDGKVYFGSWDKKLYCLDAENGEKIWDFEFETGGRFISSPCVSKGKVYFGSIKGYFYCLDAESGTKIWEFKTKGAIYSSPAVVDGKVYFGTQSRRDRRLICLDATSGEKIWDFWTKSEGIKTSPTIKDGLVYFGSENKNFYCLNASTGKRVWYKSAVKAGFSKATVADGFVYYGTYGKNLFCRETNKGKRVWKFKTQQYIESSPCVVDTEVYFGGSVDHKLYCLDAKTGKKSWEFRTVSTITSSPVIEDGRIYFGSWDNYFYCVDSGKRGISENNSTDETVIETNINIVEKIETIEEVKTNIKEETIDIETDIETDVDIDDNIPRGKVPFSASVVVLIGNKDYQNSIAPSEFALNDARIMNKYFLEAFWVNIKDILYYENATLATFKYIFGKNNAYKRSKLYRTVKRVKPGTIYIYFSGYGIPNLTDKKGYLAPVDFVRENIEATAYPVDIFYQNLKKIKEKLDVKKIVVILETSFCGNSQKGMLITGTSPIVAEINNPLAENNSGIIFTATSGSDYATWYNNKKHGTFTYFFLRGLRGDADADKNKIITVGEMKNYLKKKVPKQSSIQNGIEQVPEINGKSSEIIIRY